MAPGIDDEYDDLPMINMVVLHFATLKLPDVSPPPSQTWRAAGKSPSIAGMEIYSWDNQLSKWWIFHGYVRLSEGVSR